jgi:hypothetical protein
MHAHAEHACGHAVSLTRSSTPPAAPRPLPPRPRVIDIPDRVRRRGLVLLHPSSKIRTRCAATLYSVVTDLSSECVEKCSAFSVMTTTTSAYIIVRNSIWSTDALAYPTPSVTITSGCPRAGTRTRKQPCGLVHLPTPPRVPARCSGGRRGPRVRSRNSVSSVREVVVDLCTQHLLCECEWWMLSECTCWFK